MKNYKTANNKQNKIGERKILFYYESYSVFEKFVIVYRISELNVKLALVPEVNSK